MSGPKKSIFSIINEIFMGIQSECRMEMENEHRRDEYLERIARREAIAREKAAIRAGKEEDLRVCIQECRSQLESLLDEYGAGAVDVRRVEGWIASAEMNLGSDLRIGWREINGVRSFLYRKESALKGCVVQLQQEELSTDLSEAELLLIEIEEVVSSNVAVFNPSIEQRLDLIRGSLKINKDNPNTLGQVKSLLVKVNSMVEEYNIRKKEREFAIRAFAEAIGAEPPGSDAGQAAVEGNKRKKADSRNEKETGVGAFPPASFSGLIAGMPITVVFGDENNINLNTPEQGDCKTPLKALMGKLAEKGIKLGSVCISKTGENWNPVSSGNIQNKIRA